MIAVVKEGQAPGIILKEVPRPIPKADELLVKIERASICGTDIGIYDSMPWAIDALRTPVVIGHEIAGRIVALPKNTDGHFRIGDLVSSETHIYCGKCEQCHAGRKHTCDNLELFGISRDGGFAEYATIPGRTAWKNSTSLSVELMSMQEPIGNAMHVLAKTPVSGKRVLVVGLGPTGLSVGAIAGLNDAENVVGMDPSGYRRHLAQNLGFHSVVASLHESQEGTYDIVFEMSGNLQAIETAFMAVKTGGVFVAFGIPREKVELEWGKYFINKELTVFSIFGRKIWDTWSETSALLEKHSALFEKIITHRFPLRDIENAMRTMRSGRCGKIILIP